MLSAKPAHSASLYLRAPNSPSAARATSLNPVASRSSSDTPMTRQSGMNPAVARCSNPGSSLRRDRSPVAPKSTTTCGNLGPTPAAIFATIHPALPDMHRCRCPWIMQDWRHGCGATNKEAKGAGLRRPELLLGLGGQDLDGNRFGVDDVDIVTLVQGLDETPALRRLDIDHRGGPVGPLEGHRIGSGIHRLDPHRGGDIATDGRAWFGTGRGGGRNDFVGVRHDGGALLLDLHSNARVVADLQ